MIFFGKREKVYDVLGEKERWKAARAALKEAGIQVVEAGYYETEAPMGGCGAKLDHRNFGPNGRIDRNAYTIFVRPEDVDAAKKVLENL